MGVSIKEMLKAEVPELKSENKDKLPKDDFTVEQVLDLWNQLLKELESASKNHILGAISKTDVLVEKTNQITLVFHSNAAKAEFDKIKMDWIQEVEKSLNNFHIEFNLKVEVTESNQPKFSSPEDIYKKMVAKNPLLEKMKRDFGLDFYS